MTTNRFKFRAWDTRTNQFYPHEFSLLGEATLLGALECWLVGQDRSGGMLARLSEVDITQFSGLHDKDGAELYDGDIVKIANHYHGDHFVKTYSDVIIFEDGCFDLLRGGDLSGFCLDGNVKKMGNIYENPQLLEG